VLTATVRLTAGSLIDDGDAVALLVPAVAGAPSLDVPPDVAEMAPVDLAAHAVREKFSAKSGEILVVPTYADEGVRLLVLVGIGDASVAAYRTAAAALVRRMRDVARVRVAAGTAGAEQLGAFAEAARLAAYRFTLKSDAKPPALGEVILVAPETEERRAAIAGADARATAVALARDLANAPSADKSPQTLADEAERIAVDGGLAVRVWGVDELAAGGFGGILGVGMGSARPPRLIQLSYRPDGATRHVVIVGKGITFDSGGLSIKPADGMPLMKTDMSGGAAVLATMSALRAIGSRVAVTGLVAAAENMPSGSSIRPGDVVRHYGGRTSEVLNTDAEGRLVLADAIAYAVAELAPDAVVDLATLTGAATLGLGKRHAAFYATDEGLSEELLAAADAAGERWWRMPLVDDYRPTLDSPIADLSNIGVDPHISGGSIVAALYLREFAAGVAWAHLDMAGPARADRDEDEYVKGATGYGVRTLLTWLAAAA
jgi:leucyl aminopeptidase